MAKKTNKANESKKVQNQTLSSNKRKKSKNQKTFSFATSDYYALAVSLLATVICFFGVRKFQFVNWDDSFNFYENDLVTTITGANFWDNTAKIFTTPVIGNYNPLSIWSFAFDKLIFGLDNPGAWHMVNLALHLLCVYLVYRLVRMLGLQWQGSLLVALLFGIHPMRVESVAWVTERKDVLFGAFYLGAIINYIKYMDYGKSKHLIWVFVLFILSLLSKIQAVSLPLTLIAIDYFKYNTISIKSITKKIPYFAISLFFGLLGIYFLSKEGSIDSNVVNYPFWQRIFIGTFSLIIYLVKSIVPFRMSPLYPYPAEIKAIFYPTILIIPAYAYALYYGYKSNKKSLTFGLFFFLVNIMFLLQILGAGQGYLADRFTYIPYLGLFFIAGYYLDQYQNKLGSNGTYGIFGSVLLIFGFLTIKQTKVWENGETLWSKVLTNYKQTPLPYSNRANYYRENGLIEQALTDYSSSIQVKEEASVYNSRARLYFDLATNADTLQLALADYNKAIALDDTDGEYFANRGATFARLGMLNEATADLDQAILIKPDHAVGYLNRSVLRHGQNNLEGALEDMASYLKYKPNAADIWYESGRANRLLNRPADALPHFDKAISLNNTNGMYHYEKGIALILLNRIPEAKQSVSTAIQLQYQGVDPQVRSQLGL